MPLQVVGVGFGRTGTDSLRVALEKLGYPCYHMITAGKIDDYHKWVKADKQIRETGETSKLREIFENPERNWRASVDFPTCVYYKELMKEYPNAKFILGVRDPEKWYASAVSTIWHPWAFEWSPFMTLSHTIRDLQSLRNSYLARVLKKPYDEVKKRGPREVWDKEIMIKCFNEHIEDCKKNIPADKLLVFKVTDGWEPLCKFLGHEVPEEEFPNVNDKKQFSDDVRGANVIGGVAWVVFLGIIGGMCYLPFGIAKWAGVL